jgi:hypothetical protein
MIAPNYSAFDLLDGRISPLTQTGRRVKLQLSADDSRKLFGEFDAIVKDLRSGREWRIRRANCSRHCRCDAIAEPA